MGVIHQHVVLLSSLVGVVVPMHFSRACSAFASDGASGGWKFQVVGQRFGRCPAECSSLQFSIVGP